MSHTRNATFATTEPGINRSYTLCEFRVCTPNLSDSALKSYLSTLAQSLAITPLGKSHSNNIIASSEANSANQSDLRGVYLGKEGTITIAYWHKPRLLTVDIQSPTSIAPSLITTITRQHFGLIESTELKLEPENVKAQNPKVIVREDESLGRGVFAQDTIKKGEFIGGLYGAFHRADDCMSLPEEYRDHVMQCSEQYWRGNETAQEAVQYLNHSCDPNSGVQGLFDFVAMRDIQKGEQITTDYAMQDDSNWVVPGGQCLCGAASCRGDILPYRDLTDPEKQYYQQYISHWILHRYNLCSCPLEGL